MQGFPDPTAGAANAVLDTMGTTSRRHLSVAPPLRTSVEQLILHGRGCCLSLEFHTFLVEDMGFPDARLGLGQLIARSKEPRPAVDPDSRTMVTGGGLAYPAGTSCRLFPTQAVSAVPRTPISGVRLGMDLRVGPASDLVDEVPG
jgi:hypothetical protein